MNFRGMTEEDLNMTVWKYMTFPKFISLLTYQALWFSKLEYLDDTLEGKIPHMTKQNMHKEHQKSKEIFNIPELHNQIDNWNNNNEKYGREMIIANCWFIEEAESEKMWMEYASLEEGVLIKSTPKQLSQSVMMPHGNYISHIGTVKYVDHMNHKMTTYKGNQAIERAFIKDLKYSHEKELRLATMNFKTAHCVRPDGIQYTNKEVSGTGINNFDNAGLYIGTKIDYLFNKVVISPKASDYFYKLVKRLIQLYKINIMVEPSSLYKQKVFK